MLGDVEVYYASAGLTADTLANHCLHMGLSKNSESPNPLFIICALKWIAISRQSPNIILLVVLVYIYRYIHTHIITYQYIPCPYYSPLYPHISRQDGGFYIHVMFQQAQDQPVAIILSRQALPTLDRQTFASAEGVHKVPLQQNATVTWKPTHHPGWVGYVGKYAKDSLLLI